MRKHKYYLWVVTSVLFFTLSISLPIVGLMSGGLSAAAQTTSYIFTTIDIPLPDGSLGFTSLSDINDKGEIVGGFANSGSFSFLLDKKLRSTDIQCPATSTAPNAQAQGVNKFGEVSGFCGFGGRIHAFFRDRKGVYTILDFPGANLTEGLKLNDRGRVVGDYRDTSGVFHGFLWDNGTFFTVDVPFPDAIDTAPNGINNHGDIVGFYFDNNVTGSFPNGHPHGFIYYNGIFTSFDYPNALVTSAEDINDHGEIVVRYSDSDGAPHSVLLSNGTFTAIEVPFLGVLATLAEGINNRGQIVGRYVTINVGGDVSNPFSSHGFVATPQKTGGPGVN